MAQKNYCKLLEYSNGKGEKTQADLLRMHAAGLVYIAFYAMQLRQSVPSCRWQSTRDANRTAKCCGLRFNGSKSQGCHWSAVSSTPNCCDELSSSVTAASAPIKLHSKFHSRSCTEVVHYWLLSYLI